jgi:hypothetical protein
MLTEAKESRRRRRFDRITTHRQRPEDGMRGFYAIWGYVPRLSQNQSRIWGTPPNPRLNNSLILKTSLFW